MSEYRMAPVNPLKVGSWWDHFSLALRETETPGYPISDAYLQQMLKAALTGAVQAWVCWDEKKDLVAVLITRIDENKATGTKSLVIHTLYGFKGFTGDTWLYGIDALKKYAAAKGCTSMVAYSRKSNIEKAAKLLGAKTDWRILEWEV